MKNGSVVYTIALSAPKTGNELAEAVKAVVEKSGKTFVREHTTLGVVDDKRVEGYEIGRSSKYSYEDARIEVPDGDGWTGLIDLERSYDRLRTVNWGYAGAKYLVGSSADAPVGATKEFRDALAAQLGV